MALLEIVLYPDPALREPCEPVTEITDEVRMLLDDMAETMYEANGIGLAASQVASPHRVIVVDVGADPITECDSQLLKLINPEIIHEEGKIESEEGCLSIPDIRENVKRAREVVVKALNPEGKEITIEAGELLSICLQHEIDHLDGVLFIDHLSRLKRELVRSKIKRMARDA